jgi:hypothetical protein
MTTYTKEWQQSVIAESKATLKRTSPENLDKTRHHGPMDCYVRSPDKAGEDTAPVIEDHVAKWKREVSELEAARIREAERLSMAAQLHKSSLQCKRDIAEGMRAVSEFATVIRDRMDEMESEVNRLKAKLEVSEIRFEDLKRSVDGHQAPAATDSAIVELNPKRRA